MGCLILLGIPFALVGTFTGYLAIAMLFQSLNMQSWDRIPMQIESAELVSSGGKSDGTLSVKSTYTYQVNGQSYQGSKVSLSHGSDNIGSFHKDRHRELKTYFNSGDPFLGYVNPNDPGDAILFPQVRWGMIAFYMAFLFIFGGVGYGMLVGGYISKRKDAEKLALVGQFPDQPWRWRKDWASGAIGTESGTIMYIALFLGFFWNLASIPLLIVLPGEIFVKQNYVAAIALIFPLIGLCLLAWAVHAIMSWRKYGKSIFRITTNPGRIPGELKGEIDTGRALVGNSLNATLTLKCNERRTVRYSNKTETSSSTVWERSSEAQIRPGYRSGSSSLIPVSIQIPDNVRPSGVDALDDSRDVTWQLEATCPQPGVDFKGQFTVPIFKA